MEARKKMIERATQAAYSLAAAGHSEGIVIKGDPWDTTDLLKGAGFSTASYNNTTGDTGASWHPSVSMSVIEKRLAHMCDMEKHAKRAATLVLVWPEVQKALGHIDAEGNMTCTIISHASSRDYYAAPSPLPDENTTRLILDECGLAVTLFVTDEGYYNESGSGMGGDWGRYPSVAIIFRFK